VDTIEQRAGRGRRRHSAEFKAEAVRACQHPGVSIASVALARSINPNMLRRWIIESQGRPRSAIAEMGLCPSAQQSFVALPVPPSRVEVPPIQIELRRGALAIKVQWPASALHECAIWLREVLK
jgi:transposase